MVAFKAHVSNNQSTFDYNQSFTAHEENQLDLDVVIWIL